jgi:hypothetical protein
MSIEIRISRLIKKGVNKSLLLHPHDLFFLSLSFSQKSRWTVPLSENWLPARSREVATPWRQLRIWTVLNNFYWGEIQENQRTSDRRMLTTQGLAIFANVATIPGGGGGQYQFPWWNICKNWGGGTVTFRQRPGRKQAAACPGQLPACRLPSCPRFGLTPFPTPTDGRIN